MGLEALILTAAVFGFVELFSLVAVTKVSEQPAASTSRLDYPKEARIKVQGNTSQRRVLKTFGLD